MKQNKTTKNTPTQKALKKLMSKKTLSKDTQEMWL